MDTKEREREDGQQMKLLSLMTYWEEPARRMVPIRLTMLGSIAVAIAAHHPAPLLIGLGASLVLYLRSR